jgi:predicted nucleic acid-binding protein
MPIPLVVPDASVLLKWVLPSDDEPDVDRAIFLRDAILDETVRAVLPALWLYEVGNTVARRFPAQASAWLSALMKFGIEEVAPSGPWLGKALELTGRHAVTFYDAAYHSLAIVHGGVLVTADNRYVERAAESGSITALSEWQPPLIPPRRSKRQTQ